MSRAAPCVRGCTYTGTHQPACTCTTQCPDHPAQCAGCAPVEATTGLYCARCATRFTDAIRALPGLLAHHRADGRVMQSTAHGDPTRRATKVDQRSPSPAWDACDEVILWASAWAQVLADETGQADPVRYNIVGIPTRDLPHAVTYILNRVDQALGNPDYSPDLYAETITHEKRLTYQTGSDAPVHQLREPCPSCDHRTLIRADGSDHVECRWPECRRVWNEADGYEWLARTATR